MRFGVQIPQEGCEPSDVVAHARAAASLGYDSVFVPDHLVAVAVAPGSDVFDAWTMSTAVLLGTERIRGGPLVLSEAFRRPALLANAAATLDRLSGGRLILGIGAGWYEAEYRAYGFDWTTPGARVDRLGEALEIMHRTWRRSGDGFEGRHHRFGGVTDAPRAHQQPHPPVWVGGQGDKLLRVAARYADAWNAPVLSPDEIAQRAQRLRAYRANDSDAPIEITYEGPVWIDEDEDRLARRLERNRRSENPIARRYAEVAIAGTPQHVSGRVKEYEAAGVTHIVCHFGRTDDLRGTELFARAVMPAFR